MHINQSDISRIKELCKTYKVKTLSVFGSVLTGDFNAESDIDFAVDFEEKDPFKYFDLYHAFKGSLEKLFKRKIDLIEIRAIKNSFFKKRLEETKVLIYGQ